ncbi:MAG: winged helix-turn-helix transcriptional regulator [Anaerolineae bacterium]|nr:winged helix-turn-helix transcriptional regulator [Anaerolineae bacterium]
MNISKQTLSGEVAHKFLTIYRFLRRYSRRITDQGIRPRQFAVLRFLLERGSATVGEITDYLYTSAGAASTLISQLEEAGYVCRTRSAADSRVVNVELTAAGQSTAENVMPGGILLLRQRLGALSEDRLRLIDEALGEIMQLMEVVDEE